MSPVPRDVMGADVRKVIGMARELAALQGSSALAAHTGSDAADVLGTYAAAFGEAKVLLRSLAAIAERLPADAAGYSVFPTAELERLQEIAAQQEGRFTAREVIKPDRDKDFYVGWSHACEMPSWRGTRAEAIAEGCPPSRLRRADERGTSMLDDFGLAWDHAGLIAEQRGFLPRNRIAAYVTAWMENRTDDAWDLLEPFDGETEVRRD